MKSLISPKLRYTLVILLLVFSSACNRQENSSGNKLDLQDLFKIGQSHILAEDLYKEFTFIQPAGIKDGLIGRYFKAKIFDDYLVLSNEDKAIQVYDRQGRFIFKTAIGKGPGEFHQVNDFTIDFDNDEICILDFTNHKVTRISFKGKFLGDFNVKMGTTNFVYLGLGRFGFFTPYNFYEENGCHYDLLYISDTTGEILLSKKMKREIANSPFVCSKDFMNSQDGATFCPDYWDTIQKVTANGFSNDLILDFRQLKMPEKHWESLDLYRRNPSALGHLRATWRFVL